MGTRLLLVDHFSRHSNPAREEVWKMFCDKKVRYWKNHTTCLTKSVNRSHFYGQILAGHKFVISPPGGGYDCHRTWVALALGVVPIILKGHTCAMSMLKTLPVLILTSY